MEHNPSSCSSWIKRYAVFVLAAVSGDRQSKRQEGDPEEDDPEEGLASDISCTRHSLAVGCQGFSHSGTVTPNSTSSSSISATIPAPNTTTMGVTSPSSPSSTAVSGDSPSESSTMPVVSSCTASPASGCSTLSTDSAPKAPSTIITSSSSYSSGATASIGSSSIISTPSESGLFQSGSQDLRAARTNTGAIAGGVVGGVVALLAAATLLICLRRRARRKRIPPSAEFMAYSYARARPGTPNNPMSMYLVNKDLEEAPPPFEASSFHERIIEKAPIAAGRAL
ncbi:hypothetical protein GLOTRDRAFT_136859 [Gloeophyllum trabeum ATCC 11539]|uniref:Uncharacterized protein n=1 Tax=Gloeophyllum trabeum (strain ATCC 11539 / FP-39264 / Madison 617) TaxID=670483 RepID=S7QFY8_GLOTA|nr:uncharacterized protein GLOTRDRAFT_136859 [Gloeophyllum trabeum ATCC 11539]EPQ58073.1 hypothetical protein GLOTRDRAFT_136859 [Gloeophyllum trabeum ATCC 11539]